MSESSVKTKSVFLPSVLWVAVIVANLTVVACLIGKACATGAESIPTFLWVETGIINLVMLAYLVVRYPISSLLWIVAIVITLSAAVYQKKTGPTYPVSGTAAFSDSEIAYKFHRSWTVGEDVEVKVTAPDTVVTGQLRFKRYKSNDSWTTTSMTRDGDELIAHLPELEPAGKFLYEVHVMSGSQQITLTGEEPIKLRYKGGVPMAVLVQHVLFMFIAMLISNRALLDALMRRRRAHLYMLLTTLFLFVGGMILGPMVQKYAFGEYWTGVPWGWDLTDNKTLIIMAGWILACVINLVIRRKGNTKGGFLWIIFAALLMLVVYLIPHSMLGSELDYRDETTGGDAVGSRMIENLDASYAIYGGDSVAYASGSVV